MAYTTIDKSTLHFTPKLYTGNNGSSLTISGLNFQPDLTWIKARNATETHGLYDAVRGALYRLQSSSTNASTSTAGTVTGWTSDGFSLGTSDEVNGTYNYASWNWKANGQGSSNTDGSINTTYTSANTTAGFSISTYSGTGSAATIGHGLGAVPQVMIVKNTYQAEHWIVYHHKSNATPQDYYLRLNDTNAAADFPMWNDTAPTSSVFSVGTSTSVNQAGGTFVAYCFAEKQGFSKFGEYTGNGNADGPFIYTGFKPAFVLIKKTSAAEEWIITDNKRIGYNNKNYGFFANTNAVEQTGSDFQSIDLLSNGFKLRVNTGYNNGSGASYIYMAFAEAPLVGSNNVPATAR